MRKSDSHNVTIRSLALNQTGNYQCEVSADAPLFHTLTESSHMQVVILPEADPAMHIYGALVREEDNRRYIHHGDQIKANCIASPSLPTVNFTWRLNGVIFRVRNYHCDVDLQLNNVVAIHRPPRPDSGTITASRVRTAVGTQETPGPSCCSPSTNTFWLPSGPINCTAHRRCGSGARPPCSAFIAARQR